MEKIRMTQEEPDLEQVTVRVTVRYPGGEHSADFAVPAAQWEAMSEVAREELVDQEFMAAALDAAGVSGSFRAL